MPKLKLKYAHKTTNLVIGERYLVAHAVLFNKETGLHYGDVPIIPILHNDDNSFGVTVGDHYHLDNRFWVEQNIKHLFNIENGRTNCFVSSNHTPRLGIRFDVVKIIFKSRKCTTLETGLHPPIYAKSFFDWVNSMRGKSCAGRICPHHKAIMNEVAGKLVCPMHGLIGDIKTEIIL